MTVYSHCTENHIFFFRASWKDSLSKKNRAGIWSFLYYWEIWYFFFPKIWSYLQTENERWPFSKKKKKKKIHGNMKFSSNVLKRWTFQKGPSGTWSFLYYLERWYFFLKAWYFFPGRKTREEWPFSRDTRKHDIFYLIYSTSSCKNKNQRRSYPAKIKLKGIGIPDRLPKKGSSNYLYLHGDLYRHFHIYCSSAKKKEKPRKLNI